MNNAGNHCPSPGTHSSAAAEVSGGVFLLLQMLMTPAVGPSCSSRIPKALSIRRGEIETGKCHVNETSCIEGLGRLLGRVQ